MKENKNNNLKKGGGKMDKNELVKIVTKKRLVGGWYYFTGVVEGRNIQIKGYKTWLKVYNVNGISYAGCMDISVKNWLQVLLNPFNI